MGQCSEILSPSCAISPADRPSASSVIRQQDLKKPLGFGDSESQLARLGAELHESVKGRQGSEFRLILDKGRSKSYGGAERLCKLGQLDKALATLVGMDELGMVPSVQLYKCLLEACINKKALVEARAVRAHMAKHGLEANKFLGELLVATLVKCGSITDGIQVFEKLSRRTVFSWTAVISGYSNAGQGRQALSCYQDMLQEGVQPDKYTFVSLLKACSKLEDLEEGKRIHEHVLRNGLESDVFVGSTLVSLYAKCGDLTIAQQVFDRLVHRNVVSWTALIGAYAQRGQGERALQIYADMRKEGVTPDGRTFVSALQACSNLADKEESVLVHGEQVKVRTLSKGSEIHAEATRLGFDSDVFVASSLVSMYAKCGSLKDGREVCCQMSHHDVVSWNAMIAAFAQQDQGERALQVYEEMQVKAIKPNARTFVSALQACGALAEKERSALTHGQNVKVESLRKGSKIHAEAVRLGFESDVFVASTVVSMYGKCGSIKDARQVFDRMTQHNVVSWNAIIAAYAQQDQGGVALELYERMQEKGFRPDSRTFVSVLQACGSIADKEESSLLDGQIIKAGSLQKGTELYEKVASRGFDSDVFVGNSLVSMFAKCGSIKDARRIFDELSHKDVVSWNAIVAAYAQQDQGEKALQMYGQMQDESMEPNEATFLCVLEACSKTGALDMCRSIHQDVVDRGFECCLSVATSLIHAYGKCGSMVDARKVFEALPKPDPVSWNALIAGYARQGDTAKCGQCYEEMCCKGMKPDRVTFLALLSACSHACMVDSGLQYFARMTTEHGITAELGHFVCIIDLVGRAGLFTEVEELILKMPMQPDFPAWLCILSACRIHCNVVLGRHAFNCAVALEPEQASPYVLMSNIYAHAGMSECAREIERLRESKGAWKKAGQSWIEYKQELHTFMVGDHRHQQESLLYGLLKELSPKLQVVGYAP